MTITFHNFTCSCFHCYMYHLRPPSSLLPPPSLPSPLPSLQVLPCTDLDFLFRPPTYPAEFMGEYVRLLELFEVALRQTSDILLIPSHLPASAPSLDIPPTRELSGVYINFCG